MPQRGSRLPFLTQVSDAAAHWLLSGLLAAWSDDGHHAALNPAAVAQQQPPHLEQLAPLWRMMQVVGASPPPSQHALPPQQNGLTQKLATMQQQPAAAAERLHGLAAVLCTAVADGGPIQSAAGLLAVAGFMQGLRAARGGNEDVLSVLVHLAAWVPLACVVALEAVDMAAQSGVAADAALAALRRDAASLAALVVSQVSDRIAGETVSLLNTHEAAASQAGPFLSSKQMLLCRWPRVFSGRSALVRPGFCLATSLHQLSTCRKALPGRRRRAPPRSCAARLAACWTA